MIIIESRVNHKGIMDNKYLLAYLQEFFDDPQMSRIIDYFKADFDHCLYAYGCQFGLRDNSEKNLFHVYEPDFVIKKRTHIKTIIDGIKDRLYPYYSKYQDNRIIGLSDDSSDYKKVLFLQRVSTHIKTNFANQKIRVVCLDDYKCKRYPEILSLFDWYETLNKMPFNERLKPERYKSIDGFIKTIQTIFRDFDGLFVGNEEYFICKLFIDAFKGIGIPTFNWSHGIDSNNSGIPRRVDYRLVWGEGIKRNLIKAGEDATSIIVAGNIKYFDVSDLKKLRNSLDDVLVLTSVTVGNIQHSWDYQSFPQWDRSLLITYIYSIEKVLKAVGVKKARLRPHPINNYFWVDSFIDKGFFELDTLPLEQSFQKATLAIGPTSSTFVEALNQGVNYLVYEPGGNGKSIIGAILEPPFDGSEEKLKVAFSEEQLEGLIRTKYSCDPQILKKYMIPFSLDRIKSIIWESYKHRKDRLIGE